MLMVFAFFFQAISIALVNLLTVWSRLTMSDITEVLILLNKDVRSLINDISSLLSLTIDCWLVLIYSSTMGIVIARDTWLEESLQLEWIKWLSSSFEPLWRNMRSMTKFESCSLSEYLVGTWLVGIESSKLNKSAIIRRSSLIEE